MHSDRFHLGRHRFIIGAKIAKGRVFQSIQDEGGGMEKELLLE